MPRCAICRKKFDYAFNKFEKVCGDVECKKSYLPTLLADMESIRQRAWKEKKSALRVEVPKKSNTLVLQSEINRLSRLIDAKFGYSCIDCGKPFGKQVDASHFHNVGSHQNVRFNLHNVHSARSDCNQYHGGRKGGYLKGLIERYGQTYADYIETDLRHVNCVKMSEADKVEKIALVRRIIREFPEMMIYPNQSGKDIRDLLNNEIGIYK